MMNNAIYKDSLEYLDSFVNYEKARSCFHKQALDLERVRLFFSKAGLGLSKIKSIHIAGTNGKGSASAFAASILANAGLKVGVYTSPHLHDVRERISLIKKENTLKAGSDFISKERFVFLVSQMRNIIEQAADNKALKRISFFEILTAVAFKYFLSERVDSAVIECGMGGRLDATNLVVPRVSVITSIGYDHSEFLGRDIIDIASEKAGIIKELVPVVTACKDKDVCKALKDKADSLSCPFYRYGRDFGARNIKVLSGSTQFDFFSKEGDINNLSILLKGSHQVENACLSLVACQLFIKGGYLKAGDVKRGLKRAFIEGRFEHIKDNCMDIIFDVAHNPQAVGILNEAIKEYFPDKKVILIFGCSNDKNYPEMIKSIDYNKIIATKSNNLRASSPVDIKEKCGLQDCLVEDSARKAFGLAQSLQTKNDIIVVTGSVFLVAQIKEESNLFRKRRI